MPGTEDLEALLGTLTTPLGREVYEQIHAARRAEMAAPAPEPSIIPAPEFPYPWPHRLSGIHRYPCALGCGWAHQEDSYEIGKPVIFKLDDQGVLDEQAMNEHLAARGGALRERIEQAIRDHFTAAHPDREIPVRGTR